MDTLQITLSQLQQTSSSIRQENQQLSSCLQEIYVCMNQLSSEWQSPAAQTIRSKFQSMLPIFDQYRDAVEQYATFLDQTSATYQTMEQQLTTNAQSFQ